MLSRSLAVAIAPQYSEDEIKRIYYLHHYYQPYSSHAEAVENLILKVRLSRIPDVFLLDPEAQRFCYGKAIEYSPASQRHIGGFDFYKHIELRRRPHSLEYMKLPLAIVDQEHPEDVQQHVMLRHPSEVGWNLSPTNKRHFLKLPQGLSEHFDLVSGLTETRDLIFEYTLCIEAPRTIRPLTNIPYLESKRTLSYFEVFPDPEYFLSLVFLRREDQYGPYTEICPIKRQPIDATCLRVNKKFLNDGNRLLYSNNTFDFSMIKEFRPWKYDQDGYLMYQLRPPKPNMSTHAHVVNGVIDSIANRAPESRLTAWILEDPFLRFLYSIGPQNTAQIKSLYFRGVVKIHYCLTPPTPAPRPDVNCYTNCRHDLGNALRCYVPFIRALCLNLRRLTIKISLDSVTATNERIKQATMMAMQQFLRVDVRTITSLDELVVIDVSNDDYEWAQETIETVRRRAKKRKKLEWAQTKARMRAEAKARARRAANVYCDFCGAAHAGHCLDYVDLSS